MNLLNPLQPKPQGAASQEPASVDQLGSFNLSRSAIPELDPYANINRIAGLTAPQLTNTSLPTSARTGAVGPLTIERTIEPTLEVIVLPEGTSLRFSPTAVRPNFGPRPDLDYIQVTGDQMILDSATALTANGDGTLRAQGDFKATVPEAAILFPGETTSVRFNRLPITIREGAILQQLDYSLAA